MTVQLTTEKVGTRIYVCGNSYAVKDRLKSAGCHWDGDRKQWWIGAAKADAIASIVGNLDGKEVKQDKSELANRRCEGKVEYKGKAYYVIGVSEKTGKLWLTVLDCSIDFWAAETACKWIKRYGSTERWAGYGRGTVEEYQTVAKISRFIAKSKQERETLKSGRIPAGWCRDMEDGCIKPRHECDMPEDN